MFFCSRTPPCCLVVFDSRAASRVSHPSCDSRSFRRTPRCSATSRMSPGRPPVSVDRRARIGRRQGATLDPLARRTDSTGLHDTEGAAFPFWSPSGDSLAFFAGGKLWIVIVDGGTRTWSPMRRTVEAVPGIATALFVFAPDREGPLMQVPEAGRPTRRRDRPSPDPKNEATSGRTSCPMAATFSTLLTAIHARIPQPVRRRARGGARTALIPRASSNAVYGASGFVFFAQGRHSWRRRSTFRRLALDRNRGDHRSTA